MKEWDIKMLSSLTQRPGHDREPQGSPCLGEAELASEDHRVPPQLLNADMWRVSVVNGSFKKIIEGKLGHLDFIVSVFIFVLLIKKHFSA